MFFGLFGNLTPSVSSSSKICSSGLLTSLILAGFLSLIMKVSFESSGEGTVLTSRPCFIFFQFLLRSSDSNFLNIGLGVPTRYIAPLSRSLRMLSSLAIPLSKTLTRLGLPYLPSISSSISSSVVASGLLNSQWFSCCSISTCQAKTLHCSVSLKFIFIPQKWYGCHISVFLDLWPTLQHPDAKCRFKSY